MRSRLCFILWVGLVVLRLPGAVSAAGGPVSVSELDFWLRGGRAPAEILAEVKQRGLLESVDADAQRRLRANGADAALLTQLGNASLVVSPDAAAQARREAAALAEKDRANRALALQQLRGPAENNAAGAGTGWAPGSGRPGEASAPAAGAGKSVPAVTEIAAFPEPSGAPGAADGWRVGYVNACRQAGAEHRMVLVYFTGSDWSDACQRTEQTVFGNAQFKAYAARRLMLVRVDFPQRAIQSREVKEQNAKLADAFGVKAYPAAFLLNEQGKPVAKLTADLSTALALVTKLKTLEAKMQAQ